MPQKRAARKQEDKRTRVCGKARALKEEVMIIKLILSNLQDELANATIAHDQKETQAEGEVVQWMAGDQKQYLGNDTYAMAMAGEHSSNSLAAYRGLDVGESWMMLGQTNDTPMPSWTTRELPTPDWGHYQSNPTCNSTRGERAIGYNRPPCESHS